MVVIFQGYGFVLFRGMRFLVFAAWSTFRRASPHDVLPATQRWTYARAYTLLW